MSTMSVEQSSIIDATPEAYRELLKLIPYKRIGEPIEIGRAAVWLASDDARFITGRSILIGATNSLIP